MRKNDRKSHAEIVPRSKRGLEYSGPDEYVEATSKQLRLRKRILDQNAANAPKQSRVSTVVAD